MERKDLWPKELRRWKGKSEVYQSLLNQMIEEGESIDETIQDERMRMDFYLWLHRFMNVVVLRRARKEFISMLQNEELCQKIGKADIDELKKFFRIN